MSLKTNSQIFWVLTLHHPLYIYLAATTNEEEERGTIAEEDYLSTLSQFDTNYIILRILLKISKNISSKSKNIVEET